MVYWFKSERVRSMVHHQFGANFEFRSSLLVPVRLWISFLNLTKLSISFSKTINFLSFWYLIITFNVYNSSLFQPIYWNSLASRIFSLGDWLLKNYSVKITYLVSRIFPQNFFQNGSYSLVELGLEIGYREIDQDAIKGHAADYYLPIICQTKISGLFSIWRLLWN